MITKHLKISDIWEWGNELQANYTQDGIKKNSELEVIPFSPRQEEQTELNTSVEPTFLIQTSAINNPCLTFTQDG